ncbi:MAG TPA: carbazole dioxygenase [Methylococcales bacterium]|nr:carbazole dioxygenase [Methylococcales bacterium]
MNDFDEEKDPIVNPEVVKKIKGWGNYIQAKLGFRNHWYPVGFSEELEENNPMPIQLGGEKLLINRIDGEVFCIANTCLHRGVPLSKKIECYSKDTITCWYHGWTYNFNDGKLCDILTDPNSKMIGTRALQTYFVEEVKGMMFVYLGDVAEGEKPPALALDLPPGFLDEDRYALGIRREIGSNWRLGAENGFDTTHIFIHKDSDYLTARDAPIPLGFATEQKLELDIRDKDDAPKGVIDPLVGNYRPVFEASIKGEPALSSVRPKGEHQTIFRISLWLPGILAVENHPERDITQFEFYVPIDERKHMYFQVLSKEGVTEPEQIERYKEVFKSLHEPLALRGFNDDDVWAREASQAFYDDDYGWLEEQLFEADHNLIAWRKLASEHGREIQRAPRTGTARVIASKKE